MIWIKRRDQNGNAGDWMVGHKDLYGGASPWNGYLVLNKNQQQFIIYNILGNEDQIPVYDYKNEDSRVNKILEHWDENKNYIDSLLNTDIDKERTLNDYYMEQVHGR